MNRQIPLLPAALLVAAAALAAQSPPPRPQAAAPTRTTPPTADTQGATPIFPREVEMVTIDVVVADKAGNPVTGLAQQDFTVLDEGQPQTILSFDRIQAPEPKPQANATAAAARPRIVTNESTAATQPGRTFVVFFDSLNLSPLNAQRAKSAVLAFLDKGSRPGDRVMLASTGGGAWWTAQLPEGREDLVTVLKGLDGRRVKDPAVDRMTDFEAMRIYVYKDTEVGRRVQSRWERYGVRIRNESPAQRESDQIYVPGVVDPYVDNRAAEAYLKLKARNSETLAALQRVLRPLAATRDRKALLLVSEGFVYDPNEPGFKGTVEAARRANTAIYFVDTRGLEGMPEQYSTLFGHPIDERDMMAALADTSREGEGSVSLAHDTGGFSVTSTNDLATGIVRIGRESRSYYLIGYSPGAIARDGRFRRIEVKVRRPGVTVRARRGYYAPADVPTTTAAKEPQRIDPQMQSALDMPGSIDGIPLRLTAYVLQDATLDRARVLLTADADVSKVQFRESAGRLSGSLDTLAVIARRENSEFYRSDLKIELERKPGPVPAASWYTMVREFDLPAGVYQARFVVRDSASSRVGTVTYEFEVPPLDALRVSTPILTDTVQVSPTGTPNAVLLARRTFRSDKPLFCRFDVFGAKTEGAAGMPTVKAGHQLRRADGTLLSRSDPTTIEPTSLGALSRLMQIPLAGLAPGDYDLVLEVRDERAARKVEIVEPFTIVSGGTASR